MKKKNVEANEVLKNVEKVIFLGFLSVVFVGYMICLLLFSILSVTLSYTSCYTRYEPVVT